MPQVPKRTGFYLYSFPYTYLHGIGVLKRFLEFDNGNGILISGIDQPIPKFREQEGEWKIEIPIFRDGNQALLFLAYSSPCEIWNTFVRVSMCPCVFPRQKSGSTLSPLYDVQTTYFLKALGPRISKLILPSVSYTNTQIQIHKYTNTQIQHLPK